VAHPLSAFRDPRVNLVRCIVAPSLVTDGDLMSQEDEGQCTCGMELGKKLAAIEHLLGSASGVSDGQTLTIDLRSQSPWSRAAKPKRFELELTYGPMDKGSLKVTVDEHGRRFRIGQGTIASKERPLAWLQPDVEHCQLLRMLADLQSAAEAAAPWLIELALRVRRLLECAELPKPLAPGLRDALRVTPALPQGPGLEPVLALATLVDRSAERWFAGLGGLTAAELEQRLAKVDRAGKEEPAVARRQAEELVEIVPGHADAHARLGWILTTHYVDHHLTQGAEHLERALAIDPGHRDAPQWLGDALFRIGDVARARQFYERALKSGGGDPLLTLFGLAQVEEAAREWAAAASLYIRASRKTTDPRLKQVLELSAERVGRAPSPTLPRTAV